MTALALYLKFNLLLALAWLLWVGTKQASRLLKMDISHQRTLRLARWLFLAVLAVPALMFLLSDLLPRLQPAADSSLQAGMLAVTADLDAQLAKPLPIAGVDLQAGLWLMLALGALLGFSFYRLLRQWWALRHLTERSLLWKSLHRVRILLSEDCETPFSTRVTGPRLVASSNMVPTSFFGNGQSQLRKRISLMKKPIEQLQQLRTFVWSLILVSGMTSSGILLFAEAGLAQNDEDGSVYLPTTTIPPQYPQEALALGLQGFVQAEFTVDPEGRVRNARVINSCASTDRQACFTRRTDNEDNGWINSLNTNDDAGLEEHKTIFNESAIDAVEQFQFEPRIENGEAMETPGVQYVFTFMLDDDENENDE